MSEKQPADPKPAPNEADDSAPKSRKARWIFVGVLVALVSIVTFQNTGAVETRVLFFTFELPRALLLAIVFAAGVLVGLFLSHRRRRRRRVRAALVS